MHAAILNFQIIRPEYETTQEQLLGWIAYAHAKAEALKAGWKEDSSVFLEFYHKIKESLFKIGLGEDKIQKRGTVLGDVFHTRWDEMQVYRLSLAQPEGVDFRERSHYFEQITDALLERFYPSGEELSPHLIHVTCTGYVSPSAAQKIVSKHQKGQETVVTHAYHMGCYAALPALRIAQGFLKESVDIVHTELCTLHMNPLLHEKEQLVVHSLFADGCIKYTLRPTSACFGLPALVILALHEITLPDSSEIMTWKCEHWGMRMTLSKEVPVVIRRGLTPFLHSLTAKCGISLQEILQDALFAIHPGGTKIIQQIAEILKLKPAQIAHSQAILSQCGNMSSATLPHIWERILHDPSVPKGKKIVSLAFGPGLSLSGALLEKG